MKSHSTINLPIVVGGGGGTGIILSGGTGAGNSRAAKMTATTLQMTPPMNQFHRLCPAVGDQGINNHEIILIKPTLEVVYLLHPVVCML